MAKDSSGSKTRFFIIGVLIVACLGVEYYAHIVCHINKSYPHLFYFPILLAAFWWGLKGGLLVSIPIGLAHLASYYPGIEWIILIRGLVIIFIGVTVGLLSKKCIQTEGALRGRTNQLGKRIKELNCLYGLTKLVETQPLPEEIFRGAVDLVPSGWQYPEGTCARITFGDQTYQTPNFRETFWKQVSDITVHGERVGALEVCYLEEKPPEYEGPFLKEERDLIKAFTERLGRIVERKRAEDTLRETIRLRDLYLEILVHDLSSPLTAVGLCLDLTSEDQLKWDFKIFETIRRRTMDMESLVDKALYFTRLQRQIDLEKKTLDLNQRLTGIVEDFLPFAREKQIEIEFVPDGPLQLRANDIIDQVFANLLSNAIRYSPEQAKVMIGAEKSGDHVRVFFKDRGGGVADEDKELIFSRFERRHRGPVKGVGLGLAIAKKITELHQGRIWVEDNPGGGSIFSVEIPSS